MNDEEEFFESIIEDGAQDPVNRAYQELLGDDFDASHIRESLAARDPDERAFLALVMCSAEVDNGGFEQLFGNSADEIARHGVEGAKRFGLPRQEELIQSAWDRWRESSPYEREEPDERLSELDEEWYAVDEELQRRLLEFARLRSNAG